jgi:multisubunit Na+/H+ antiporter MnhB subunit
MAQETQSLANHTRWHPPYHFVLAPILLLHFLYTAYQLYLTPDFAHAEALLLAFALVLMVLLVRINPLRAQDRLIRLEEQLRYQHVLPADLAARAAAMPVRFIVALRFASDAELPELVKQVLAEKFAKPAEVKKAIKNWRGDYFRV